MALGVQSSLGMMNLFSPGVLEEGTRPRQGAGEYFPVAPVSALPEIRHDAVDPTAAIWNSAISQTRSNPSYNAAFQSSYDEALRRWQAGGSQGPAPEAPGQFLTNFDDILSYGLRGVETPKPANTSYFDFAYAPGTPLFRDGKQVGVQPDTGYNATQELMNMGPNMFKSFATMLSEQSGLPGTAFDPSYGTNPVMPGATTTGQPGTFAGSQYQTQPGTFAGSPYQTGLPALQPYGQTSPAAARGDMEQFLANQANQMRYLEQTAQGQQGTAEAISSNPDVAFLRNLVQNQQPLDATSAWRSMIAAQEENIDRGRANISEMMNMTGNRVGSAFGESLQQFQNQATKDQNALLAQMQLGLLESERGRQFQGGSLLAGLAPNALMSDAERQARAASQLGQYAFAGPSQLSQMDLQRYMQASGQSFDAAALQAQLDMQRYLQENAQAFNASMYGAQGADAASQQLLNNAMGAGQQLLQNSVLGANQLFNTENAAAMNLFGAQNQFLPFAMQQQAQNAQLGLQQAMGLGGLWNQNLQTGAALGGQQYQVQQDQINRQYQEWLRTQPWYHPYLQMLQQGAMFQPNMYFPQYQPSILSQLSGLISGAGGLMLGLGGLGVGRP